MGGIAALRPEDIGGDGELFGVVGPGDTALVPLLREQAAGRATKVVGAPWHEFAGPEFRTTLALAESVGGPPFVPGGRSASDALVSLAMQVHQYETIRPFLADGRVVIEQGGVYAAAVHAALAHDSEDLGRALDFARCVVETAALWRPLPSVVLFAGDRAELQGDGGEDGRQWRRPFSPGLADSDMAVRLLAALAADDPQRWRQVDIPAPKARKPRTKTPQKPTAKTPARGGKAAAKTPVKPTGTPDSAPATAARGSRTAAAAAGVRKTTTARIP